MKLFGLIGKNISYSFSENYFAQKFLDLNLLNCKYQIFDLQSIEEVFLVFDLPNLQGFNVTIPYKESIIDYLDELSPEAQKIGAVNCVKLVNGKKIGFNTDAFGFENSLKPLLTKENQKALIFGNGGAAKAIKFALEKLEIPYQVITRNGEFTYEMLSEEIFSEHQILINCTPVGTYPNVENTLPIPFDALNSTHLAYDLIYNPKKTKFLQIAETKGAIIKNGYEMLQLQADKSWEIWNQPL